MAARLLKDPATANCRVFVGHLQSEDISKMEFEQHFSKYGMVIGSLINRGFGFIQYENESSAQAAIQNENGQMFKGRRIDVKPAKKDSSGGGGGDQKNNFSSPRGGGNQSFNQKNTSFNNSNCDTSFDDNDNKNSGNSGHDGFNSNDNNNPDDDNGNDYQQFNSNQNDSFNNGNSGGSGGASNNNQGKDNKEQFNSNNQNKNNTNNNNANRMDEDNSNTSSGSQNNRSGGQANPRQRGTRGGKNRNKNRAGGGDNSGNFRDRSPLNRGPMNRGPGGPGNDDKNNRGDWGDHNMMRNNFNRDNFNDNNRFDDRFKDPMGMGGGPGLGMGLGGPGMGLGNPGLGGLGGPGPGLGGPGPGGPGNFGRMGGPSDFPMPQAAPAMEKNDCEIIVVHKNLTEYAEAIEARLKKMGLTVDLLFPNEEVPLSRVLGNIANRGCLYAVVIMPINMEHHSLTLNILHGLPQEHRNMPTEDALALISRDFSNYKSGGRGVPFNTPFASDRHPDAIQVLLNMLADNHQLTVLQYERVIKYLEVKREEQVQVELGDAKDLAGNSLAAKDPKQAELQSRILNILNSNKTNAPVPSPVPAPAPVPAPLLPVSTTVTSSSTSTTGTAAVTPSPLLNDPTVQKALDSLLQGNLLKSIGDSQPASSVSSSAPQPLFAAFSNINRF
ncbi:uncharacterized protein LOC123274538 isoform X3 [Cotesia glomerata]|uniref:uncharacterized protein LOC123274538 isoform X3 n=1 Tax=Cotesia glomerata TaxID=32391 RepID=UPI001D00669B|nr:uncharacterized protein LOC123274538 isoform X3 [Cotesia glomerata]